MVHVCLHAVPYSNSSTLTYHFTWLVLYMHINLSLAHTEGGKQQGNSLGKGGVGGLGGGGIGNEGAAGNVSRLPTCCICSTCSSGICKHTHLATTGPEPCTIKLRIYLQGHHDFGMTKPTVNSPSVLS